MDAFVRMARPRPGSRVLDLACGWGRHLLALRKAGLLPVGLERSEEYLARARRRAGKTGSGKATAPELAHAGAWRGPLCRPCLVRGDMRALPLRDSSVDFVVSFFTSLFYFDHSTHRRMLGDIARVLRPGGALYLDLQNPRFLRRKPRLRHARRLLGGAWLVEEGAFDARRGVDILRVTLEKPDGRVLRGGYRIRCYRLRELEALLGSAGLRVARAWGSVSGASFDEAKSEEMLVLARKPRSRR